MFWVSVPIPLDLDELEHMVKDQAQHDDGQGGTSIRKRSEDFYRMNHLTRLGDSDMDYEHGILRRGKRTNSLLSVNSFRKYLEQNMEVLKNELDAKKSLLKELDDVELEKKSPWQF